MNDDEDIKVSPAQRAYLAAFDDWLHTLKCAPSRQARRRRQPRELALAA